MGPRVGTFSNDHGLLLRSFTADPDHSYSHPKTPARGHWSPTLLLLSGHWVLVWGKFWMRCFTIELTITLGVKVTNEPQQKHIDGKWTIIIVEEFPRQRSVRYIQLVIGSIWCILYSDVSNSRPSHTTSMIILRTHLSGTESSKLSCRLTF